VCWQLTLCDPHLRALEVRFSRRCAIQIDVYLYLTICVDASIDNILPMMYICDEMLVFIAIDIC